jgi:hypothetical protein
VVRERCQPSLAAAVFISGIESPRREDLGSRTGLQILRAGEDTRQAALPISCALDGVGFKDERKRMSSMNIAFRVSVT